MEIVRFLVEEIGEDVNAMDVDEGQQMPNHWGVPMAYAAPAGNGEGDGGVEVVRWLLERGADPCVRDCWGMFDVFGLAKQMKNDKVLGVLVEWKVEKEKA